MKNSEYLFFLIKSLTKRDRDNLMRYARIRGKKVDYKYLELFRAIDQQETYEEDLLKAEFDFSNFSEAKKHLMELILKVLRIFDVHPQTEMQNRLTEIRILLDRDLHHFAMKKILQAKEIALGEERYHALFDLADYQLRALPFVEGPSELQAAREQVVAERDAAVLQLEAIRQLKDIEIKEIAAFIDQASRSGRFDPDSARLLEEREELLQADEELPVRARSTKYRIFNVIKLQQLDFAGRAAVLERMIQLFEENSYLIDEDPVRYVFSLGGYGMCLNVVGRYQEALLATMKLRELRTDKVNLSRGVFLNFATNISVYTLRTGDTGPFSEHLPYLLAALREHRSHTPGPTLAYIQYLLSIDFWLSEDIRRANRFAKRVVNEPSGRMNLQAACRCFLLIFAYEEGDPDMIIYYARTWRRQWKKKAPTYAVEQSFADFMVRFIDLVDRREQEKALAAYLEDLGQLLSGGLKVRADNFVFLLRWMEAKIDRKRLVEVVREQARKEALESN